MRWEQGRGPRSGRENVGHGGALGEVTEVVLAQPVAFVQELCSCLHQNQSPFGLSPFVLLPMIFSPSSDKALKYLNSIHYANKLADK